MATNLGMELASGDWDVLASNALAVLMWVIGCCFSTYIFFGNGRFRLNFRFGLVLWFMGIVLCMTAQVVESSLMKPPYDLAKATIAITMGMQNGLSVAWGASVAKTTHVTGFLTDTCVMLVTMIITAMRKDLNKFLMFSSFYLSYITGAFFGRSMFIYVGTSSIYFPASYYFLCGFVVLTRERGELKTLLGLGDDCVVAQPIETELKVVNMTIEDDEREANDSHMSRKLKVGESARNDFSYV